MAEFREGDGTAELERAKACLAELPPGTDPAPWALAWIRVLRVDARLHPAGRSALLARARELLESTRPGPDEAPLLRREARALRNP